MARSRQLHLNQEEKKFLGVCAGVADYLEVAPWTVRLVFLVALLMGAWFLVPVYFGVYLCLTYRNGSLAEHPTVKHFRNVDYKKQLYRNPRDGKFLGVCAGIADYLEVNVLFVRLAALILFFTAGPIPWLAYFGAYFVLNPKPDALPSFQHGEFDCRRGWPGDPAGHADSPQPGGPDCPEGFPPRGSFRGGRRDIKDCARRFSTLQTRLARMEAYVTSPRFKLNREFRKLG